MLGQSPEAVGPRSTRKRSLTEAEKMPAVGSGLSAKKRTSAGEGGFVMVKTDQFNLNQPITMMNAQSITNPFLSIDEDSLDIPHTPGRIAVSPQLQQQQTGIALLTPSRPTTPRQPLLAHHHPYTTNHHHHNRTHNTPSTPKADKGLRHFSARVSAKVEQKGCTTYNEVADELVQEIGREAGIVERYDHKNIRRRVYDALNVLMAIDIIKKDKKDIQWLGMPTDASQDVKMLEAERAAMEKKVADKRKAVGELVHRSVALRALITRNQRLDVYQTKPVNRLILPDQVSNGSSQTAAPNDRLYLPFILVNAPKDCRVHCEMLEDRTQYFFEFDAPFFINEDIELMRLMGMDVMGREECLAFLPKDLYPYMPSYNTAGAGSSGGTGMSTARSNQQDDARRLYSEGNYSGYTCSFNTTANTIRPGNVGNRPPPHLLPNGPLSDGHFFYSPMSGSSTQQQQPQTPGLSKRFRETLNTATPMRGDLRGGDLREKSPII